MIKNITYLIKSIKNQDFLLFFGFTVISLVFFGLLFLLFPVTYNDIYFFHILSFNLFPRQTKFCNYLLLAFLTFLYHILNNLLIYFFFLIISFFNGIAFNGVALTHFLYINKYTPLFSFRIIHYVYCIIFALVPKVNFAITSFNRNNSNIIKIHSFLH